MHYSIWLHLGHMQQHSICGKEFLLQSSVQQPHVEAPLAESTVTFSPADSTAGWLAVQNPLLPKLGETVNTSAGEPWHPNMGETCSDPANRTHLFTV